MKHQQPLLTIATTLTVAILVLGLSTTTRVAASALDDDDSSTTSTDQASKQRNDGSGESINISCAENLISSAGNTVCSTTGVEPGPDPDPDPEPGTPTIEIRSVHCTDLTATQRGVAVEFTVAGIEHDSEALTFTVLVLSSEGVEHIAEITIPANAPNPATTFVGFSLPLEEGEHTILAFINDQEVRETFVAPSCS